MSQQSTTNTLIAFATVFAAGMLCTRWVKAYCRAHQSPCPRHASDAKAEKLP